ncbi:hypothetical protein GALL_522550 [mine drainage metagenome]|uniref:Uncharacterized protein n=1 Tax=mine drainage metagenome TaxID=410659 RepID=A0A1J5PLL1_9ZZZZ
MGHHLLGTIIGQRQQAAAIGHQRGGAATNGGERIDRDVHRHAEVAARGVNIAAAQLVLVGETDGMDHEVKLAPDLLKMREQRIQRGFVCHITFDHLCGANRGSQGLHTLFQGLALIGKGQFGPVLGAGPGDPPGNGFVIRKAHDQPALAVHQSC